MFVTRKNSCPSLAFEGDWGDLVSKVAGSDSGRGAVLRGEGKLILFVARDLVLLGQDLGRLAHHHLRHGAEEAVTIHAVDQFLIAKAISPAGAIEIIRKARH